jgi:hypothetical protein
MNKRSVLRCGGGWWAEKINLICDLIIFYLKCEFQKINLLVVEVFSHGLRARLVSPASSRRAPHGG